MVMAQSPGFTAPAPMVAEIVSMAPAATGVPALRPVACAACFVTCPTISHELKIGGIKNRR